MRIYKILLVLSIYFVCQQFMYGQLTSEKIFELHKNIEKKLKIKNSEVYNEGLEELKRLENDVIKTKDTTLILEYYFINLSYYGNNLDYLKARKILIHCEKILRKKPIKQKMGLLYNSFFVIETDTLKKIKYLELAGIYIKKYATLRELNAYNINKYRFYLEFDTKKSLECSLEALKPIEIQNSKETTLGEIKKNNEYLLYHLTNIVRAYVVFKEFDKAKNYLNRLENVNKNSKVKIQNFPYVLYNYNSFKLILNEQNSIKRDLLIESLLSFESFVTLKKQQLNVQSNLLKISYEENQKSLEQIKNKEKDIYFKNVIAYFITFLLLVLLVFGYFFYKYKTKITNNLHLAVESKTTFLNNITHELRTPINTVKSVSYLLLNDKEKIDYNLIELINFSNNHLLNLINDIIEFNQNKNPKLLHKFIENTNIKYIIRNIYHSVVLNAQNGNELELILDEKIPESLYFDEKKISQILINLLTNSMKFTINGKIEFVIKLINQSVSTAEIYFEVSDNGLGISKDSQLKVFEVMTQENENVKQKFGGSGIGLSIVKKYVEELGGKIYLESEKNKGTKISFSLTFDKKHILSEKITNNNNENLQKKILLVEDNKINQLITKKIIEKTGYTCEVANDGQEAVEMIRKNSYCMVFMDIMMPVMDGFEATAIINKDNPEIPIVVLSAISDDLNKEKLVDLKILKFISKPINANELYDVIASL